MGERVSKYTNQDDIPMRSKRNEELYKQIYNAYDEFENLVVPSNAREINLSDLKREITEGEDNLETREKDTVNNSIIRKEKIQEEQTKEDEIYDINKLIDKAVVERKEPVTSDNSISNGDYLKKLKLDKRRTNIEQVKEIYDDLQEEAMEEDESLLKTANLSLEILSDLKGDNDKTVVSAPIKNDELPDTTSDFYSNTYKFSKKDFEDKDYEVDDEEDEDEELEEKSGNGKFFFKVLLLVLGIMLIVGGILYAISYFNRA